ncbi:hypothetical protein IG631_06168 [Alternaria alternata]|nr:hypothetical protein IG631_06168 [Alternaria alternata]
MKHVLHTGEDDRDLVNYHSEKCATQNEMVVVDQHLRETGPLRYSSSGRPFPALCPACPYPGQAGSMLVAGRSRPSQQGVAVRPSPLPERTKHVSQKLRHGSLITPGYRAHTLSASDIANLQNCGGAQS